MTAPKYFDQIWANSGIVTAISDTVTGDGTVNYPQGWTSLYQTNISSGGKKMDLGAWNQFCYDVTGNLQQLQNYGVPVWYSGVSYPLYAKVLYTDGHVYESLIATNTNTPAAGAYWKISDASSASYSVVGSIRNGKMSVTAASATATFTADEVVVESALGGPSTKLASYSQTINLATTGAGGMDTGSAPTSGYVGIYAIYNPTTNTQSILATNATSAASPSVYGGAHMPSGYTASALISVWPTNASSQFIAGYQRDRLVVMAPVTVLNTGTTQASYTSLSIAGAVPLNATTAIGTLFANSGGTGGFTYTIVSSDANNTMYFQAGVQGQGIGDLAFSNLVMATAQTLYYKATNTNSGTPNFIINIDGYTI